MTNEHGIQEGQFVVHQPACVMLLREKHDSDTSVHIVRLRAQETGVSHLHLLRFSDRSVYTEQKNSVGMHTPFTQNTLLTLRFSAMYDGPLPQVNRTFDRRPEVMVSLFTSCLLPSFFAHRLARSRIPTNPETAALQHLIDIGLLAWLLLLCWLPRRALTGPYYSTYVACTTFASRTFPYGTQQFSPVGVPSCRYSRFPSHHVEAYRLQQTGMCAEMKIEREKQPIPCTAQVTATTYGRLR